MNGINKKLDMLKELFNIGVGGAATALSKMVKTKLIITVPQVYLASVKEIIELFDPPERKILSIYIKISDNFPSGILLIFDEDSAKKLVKLAMPSDSIYKIDELMFISVLKEISNIMTSYFLNNFSQFVKMPLSPGIPHFAFDMASAILESIIAEHKEKPNEILIVKAEIYNEKERIFMDFLLIPEELSLKLLFEKIIPCN